jgi:hypothetical protein
MVLLLLRTGRRSSTGSSSSAGKGHRVNVYAGTSSNTHKQTTAAPAAELSSACMLPGGRVFVAGTDQGKYPAVYAQHSIRIHVYITCYRALSYLNWCDAQHVLQQLSYLSNYCSLLWTLYDSITANVCIQHCSIAACCGFNESCCIANTAANHCLYCLLLHYYYCYYCCIAGSVQFWRLNSYGGNCTTVTAAHTNTVSAATTGIDDVRGTVST